MGLFDGLLGRNRVQRPAASPYRPMQANALAQTGATYGTYATGANQAGATINRFQPGYESAVQQGVDNLRRGTTDAERAQMLAPTVSAINQSYNSGASRLSGQLAQRGITGGTAAGGLAALENNRVGGLNTAYRMQNDQEIERQRNAPLQIAQLLGGVIGNARNDQADNLRGQLGVNQALYSGYGQLAGSDEAREAAYQQLLAGQGDPLAGLLGGAAEFAGGQLFGKGGKWESVFKRTY